MKRSVYSFTLVIFILALLVQGCDIFLDEYDIRIINDTNFEFSVYLDGVSQFRLDPGSRATIEDVEGGVHTLKAKVDGEVIAERTTDVDENIEWTVYVETYDIEVINDTDFDFDIYLDSVFQFELEFWDSGVIENVLEGDHILEALIDDAVIAERDIYLDEDLEWTIYTEED